MHQYLVKRKLFLHNSVATRRVKFGISGHQMQLFLTSNVTQFVVIGSSCLTYDFFGLIHRIFYFVITTHVHRLLYACKIKENHFGIYLDLTEGMHSSSDFLLLLVHVNYIFLMQVNHVTSWIDGSFIYGPVSGWTDALRKFKGGLLKLTDRNLPSYNTKGLPLDNFPPPRTHKLQPPKQFWG